MASESQTLREVLIGLFAAGGMALVQNLPKLGGFLGVQWTEKQRLDAEQRAEQKKLESAERNKLITLLETDIAEKKVYIHKLEGKLDEYSIRFDAQDTVIAKLRLQIAELQMTVGTNQQKINEVKRDIKPVQAAADTLKHMAEEAGQ